MATVGTASRAARGTFNENLILTPAKLRLHSQVVGPYVTCLWLPNSILAGLILYKIASNPSLAWWMVFLPQWVGHIAHLALVAAVFFQVDKLVIQQLGPSPPTTASPGMVLQYTTMFADRRACVLVDNINSLVENVAGLIVKVMMCRALTAGVLSSPAFSWRMLLLPCWIAWGLTFAASMFKPPKERTVGTMRDLLFICLLFVALKLDDVAAYSWAVVFLIPWMWFGALFLGAIVTAGVIVVAYTCMDLRELALPGGFLLLLLSAGSQLPFFIYMCGYLNGGTNITVQQIMVPQIASWAAMWVSGMIVCYGLYRKELLRARLAATGQVWTAHESAARQLMSLELEGMQQQVNKMSNEELAQVAMQLMAGKAPPQQLLRVGTTLYRRARSINTTSGPMDALDVIMRIDGDGTAELTDARNAAAAAMEEGTSQPAALRSNPADLDNLERGSVCVSIQLLPKALSSIHNSSDKDMKASEYDCQTTGRKVTASDDAANQQPPGAVPENSVSTTVTDLESAAATAAAAPTDLGLCDADDGLCTICYDQPATCVFMECGHGGYCWRCAHVLFARPPSECPVCRQKVQQVVELEDTCCQLGRPARVKQQQPNSKPVVTKAAAAKVGWFRSCS